MSGQIETNELVWNEETKIWTVTTPTESITVPTEVYDKAIEEYLSSVGIERKT